MATPRRIQPWAARLGEQARYMSKSAISATAGAPPAPQTGPQRINIHWATLQLPPSLIDYILVHELAHIRETNHTPDFWLTVARLMPSYEQHKITLATIGKNIWLGSVVRDTKK